MVGVQDVEEEGDAAGLEHVLHNIFALLADLANAAEEEIIVTHVKVNNKEL